ncbi:protein of unknown function [Legionella fallonii LLAP-10]|uniref:Uncharacterized protein n=1 Tax=Legionella fallonii LLAP-10 TaxID=1212491 RepID=A0A098G182_9GAMM|nr:protein of unknown function [Legionella fallonii LLAP-10]
MESVGICSLIAKNVLVYPFDSAPQTIIDSNYQIKPLFLQNYLTTAIKLRYFESPRHRPRGP